MSYTQIPNNKSKHQKTHSILDFLLYGKMETLDPSIKYIDHPKTKKPFAEYYDKNIVPLIKEFEKDRIEILNAIRWRALVASLISLNLIIGNFFALSSETATFKGLIFVIIFTAVVLIALFRIWIWEPEAIYSSQIKYRIFPLIFKFISPDCEYYPRSPLTTNSLKQFRIIPQFDYEKAYDYLKITYKDVTIELYQSELKVYTGTGKDKSLTTKFRAVFILFNMNKNFRGSTIVLDDLGSAPNRLLHKVRELKNVKLEDPKFEDFFEVYSSDQVEARYLLTTSFMERLSKLRSAFGDDSIEASFHQNKLLLMVAYYQDLFETSSIMQPPIFIEEINTIFRQVENIFQIIDTLKLNEQTRL